MTMPLHAVPQQLDKTMHTMMARKAEKQAQIDADTKAVAELDAKISSHIQVRHRDRQSEWHLCNSASMCCSHLQPNLQRLKETIKQKTELRDNVMESGCKCCS